MLRVQKPLEELEKIWPESWRKYLCRMKELSLTGKENGINRSLGYFAVKAHMLRLQTYFFFFFAHSLCTPDVVAELLDYFSTETE